MHGLTHTSTAHDARPLARLATVDGKPVPDPRLGLADRNGVLLTAAPLPARLAEPQGAWPQ
jgi:hypothetical protein